jgi:hypothetical protein
MRLEFHVDASVNNMNGFCGSFPCPGYAHSVASGLTVLMMSGADCDPYTDPLCHRRADEFMEAAAAKSNRTGMVVSR